MLVGYYIAGFLALWYLLLLMLSGIVGVVFFGAWIRKLISKSPEFVFDWQTVLLGVVAIMVLKFIPIIGWLFILPGIFDGNGRSVEGCERKMDK